MSIARAIGCAVIAALFVGCGTIEQNAWTSGVAREDAYEIRDIVHAAHPDCHIYSYNLDPNHPNQIFCHTSCETYLLRRAARGWKIVTGVEVITVV